MRIRLLPIKPQLQHFVDAFWWFESAFGMHQSDIRVIVPNGKAKLLFPIKMLFLPSREAWLQTIRSRKYFIGVWDKPVVLSTPAQQTDHRNRT
jgi:hypothetical protein